MTVAFPREMRPLLLSNTSLWMLGWQGSTWACSVHALYCVNRKRFWGDSDCCTTSLTNFQTPLFPQLQPWFISLPMLSSTVRVQQAPGVLNNLQAVGSEIINSSVTTLGILQSKGIAVDRIPQKSDGSPVSCCSGIIKEHNVSDLMYRAAYFRELED